MENVMENMTCDYPLGYAFVKVQKFGKVYDFDTALDRGTLFPELDLPLGVYGCKGWCKDD